MTLCPFGFDPFDPSPPSPPSPQSAFEAHLLSCAHCAEVASVTTKVKRTWSRAVAHDDARAVFREQRLARMPARRPRASMWMALAMVLCSVLAVLASRRLARSSPEQRAVAAANVVPTPVATSPASAPVAQVPPVATAAVPAPASPAANVAAWPGPLTVVASRGVKGADAMARGAMTRGETVTIAKGARLSLGFAIDAPSLVDVEGPAAIGVRDAELELTAGSAEVRATSPVGLRTPHARIHASGASYRVVVDASSTRVERRTGSVIVEAISADGEVGASRTISEGLPVSIDAAGSYRTANADPESLRVPTGGGRRAEARWQSALEQLENGDRAGAETTFRALAHDRAASPRLRSRASFRAAELSLGRGDPMTARIELAALLDAPDASLASDAALLLSSTLSTPSERREVWDRLLARELPEPYRAHALSRRAAE